MIDHPPLPDCNLKLKVTEASQAGEARRVAAALARDLGFDEVEAGKAAIVASEAASNLSQYAQQGELLLRPLAQGDSRGLEILALDKGPGIADVAECLRDGYSTGSGAGIGLGAISRLSALFDIYSRVPMGTALLARLWSKPAPAESDIPLLDIGALCAPAPGQIVVGDGWAVHQSPERSQVLVVDGLGHGPLAAEAAQAALRLFGEHHGLSPAAVIEAAHSALHATRGAVMAVAEVDSLQQTVRFCGVGNITGAVYSAGRWHGLISYEGTVGYAVHKIREFSYPWVTEATPTTPLLIMHSDGLTGRWNLDHYPGLMRHHPGLIAGILYRDFRREHDDATVVVARPSSHTGPETQSTPPSALGNLP